MRTTFSQLKASRIPKDLGLCPTDSRLLEYVNEAQAEMLNHGSWWGTVQRAQFCVTQGCLTWPREVANIEAVTVCGNSIPIRNNWYEFLEPIGIRSDTSSMGLELIDRPNACTFSDISAVNKLVRLYVVDADDIGKRVVLQGNDQNGVWIRNKYGTEWIDGERLTLASPYVESVSTFYPLTGIQKPSMVERLLAYEADATTGLIRAIGTYQPDERVPDYRRSFIPGLADYIGCTGCAATTVTVTAIVKLQHVPIANDADYLIIGNLKAFKLMCKAIMEEEAGNEQEALTLKAKTYAELNHELRTMTGDVRSVRVSERGSPANMSRVFSGFR